MSDQMSDHETRITVLEKLAEQCDGRHDEVSRRFDRGDEHNVRMFTVLNEHLQADTQSQNRMTEAITRLVVTGDTMAITLKEVVTGANLAVHHEVVATTVMKIGATLVVLVGAAWAVFTFGHSAGWF